MKRVAKASERCRKNRKNLKRVALKRTKQGAKPKAPVVNFEKLVIDHRENGRKLARSILRRWRVRMAASEIDSIVDLTLCEAASRFSPKKGAAFMTFFFYHLRGQLVRAVSSAAQNCSMFVNAGSASDMDPGDFRFQASETVFLSLAEESSAVPHEVENPEELLLKKEKTEICESACRQLSDLERTIIMRSFRDDESLVDIARSMGYSRCHISRVKKKALDILKSAMGTEIFDVLNIKNPNAAKNVRSIDDSPRSARRRALRSLKENREEFSGDVEFEVKAA